MNPENKNDLARLIISCPDKKGIVSMVSTLLFENGANITESSQHSTFEENPQFFMRVVFEIKGLYDNKYHNDTNNTGKNNNAGGSGKGLNPVKKKLEGGLRKLASEMGMSYYISYLHKLKRMAIFVSEAGHCLNELLWLWKSGDIEAEIPIIISNHNDLKNIADFYKIPYFHVPVSSGGNDNRASDDKILSLLAAEKIDFIVLARYMQVLSPRFLKSFGKKIINIHHSFLPSFPGAKPYEKAFERGVKIIGATAHFVNEELDGGPIIEQDIIRVDHDDDVRELKRKGKIIEKIVLSRAVKWYAEDRIIEKGNKTIVFT
ncbi:MAG: formyltetrahydrofolate deformylase [Deltaproteobacteria bacterium]|nr:formyltetrahydrofolate deformylase [Deltaproteobacteria bacterium]